MPDVGTQVEGHPVSILVQFLFHGTTLAMAGTEVVGDTPDRSVGVLPIGRNVSHPTIGACATQAAQPVRGLPKLKRRDTFRLRQQTRGDSHGRHRVLQPYVPVVVRTTILRRTIRWDKATKPPPHAVDLTAARTPNRV